MFHADLNHDFNHDFLHSGIPIHTAAKAIGKIAEDMLFDLPLAFAGDVLMKYKPIIAAIHSVAVGLLKGEQHPMQGSGKAARSISRMLLLLLLLLKTVLSASVATIEI